MTKDQITVEEFKEWLATAPPGAKKTVLWLNQGSTLPPISPQLQEAIDQAKAEGTIGSGWGRSRDFYYVFKYRPYYIIGMKKLRNKQNANNPTIQ